MKDIQVPQPEPGLRGLKQEIRRYQWEEKVPGAKDEGGRCLFYNLDV